VTTDLEIERIFREEHGRVVASLIRRFGDIDVAGTLPQRPCSPPSSIGRPTAYLPTPAGC
jgi:predicted RNA polymerase sigma factor